MTTHWIFIRAHDAWMFRDSKPFSAGQNFYARSMFPPHPGTMQGVIRSHYLETSGVDLAAFGRGELKTDIGTPTSMGALTIEGPFLARMQGKVIERLIRTPFDVLKNKGDDTRKYRILAPGRELDFVTDSVADSWRPPVVPGQKDDEQYEDAGDWLTESGFKQYLNGNIAPKQVLSPGELYENEERVGLGINYGRRSNEMSQFYRAQFIRPRDDLRAGGDVGLLVGVNQEKLFSEASGLIRIGGEGRSGLYEKVTYDPPRPQFSTRIKLVLLTPAYFSGGWQPIKGWSPWLGNGARLVSMILGKPQAVSGWNMVRKAPKPLLHLVPAGSVYYFECQQPVSIQTPFTESPLNEPEYNQMGFGAVAIGTWDYIDSHS